MSKERARRRAEREHQAALRSAARAAQDERRERRAERARARRSRLPGAGRRPAGRPTGVLAERRRRRTGWVLSGLAAVQLLVWISTPDWSLRAGALVLGVLVAPVVWILATS